MNYACTDLSTVVDTGLYCTPIELDLIYVIYFKCLNDTNFILFLKIADGGVLRSIGDMVISERINSTFFY